MQNCKEGSKCFVLCVMDTYGSCEEVMSCQLKIVDCLKFLVAFEVRIFYFLLEIYVSIVQIFKVLNQLFRLSLP